MLLLFSKVWYWYCSKCGLGPYSSDWDSCAGGHKRPEKTE